MGGSQVLRIDSANWRASLGAAVGLTACSVALGASVDEGRRLASDRILVIADNQERELFGQFTGLSAKLADDLTKVAIRSSEQELFARFVMAAVQDREAERDGGPKVAIHLGDLLDYSCRSEWARASRALFGEEASSRRNVFLLPGNHDGIFQGNRHYWGLSAVLSMMKLFVSDRYDPKLDGHWNAVCRLPDDKETFLAASYKKHFFCAYGPRILAPDAWASAGLETACNITADGRTRGINTAEGMQTSIDVGVAADETVRFRDPSDIQGRIAVTFGPQTRRWSKGFFVQDLVIPMGPAAKRQAHVIMLDSTDWSDVPTFKLVGRKNNSAYGAISIQQRGVVERWIASTPDEPYLLATHYPLASYERTAQRWLDGLLSGQGHQNVIPVLLSAHTHHGSIRLKEGQMHEINMDSLIDAPVGYRNVVLSSDGTSVRLCTSLVDPYQSLGCDASLGAERPKIENAAGIYFVGRVRDNKRQWAYRATDALRAMNAFARDNKLPECQQVTFKFFRDTARALGDCEARIEASIWHDSRLVRKAACTSIVAARSFRTSGHLVRTPTESGVQCRTLNLRDSRALAD